VALGARCALTMDRGEQTRCRCTVTPAPHMPTPDYLLAPEHRRALELLAACRNGCSEGMMLAQGFSIDMMVELIDSGLATTLQTERIVAGGYEGGRARVRITEAGRRVLSKQLAAR
jgi:hypothetical protein